MRLVLSKEHRHFYEQNGWVEFEEMLTPEVLQALCKGVDEIICKRLQITSEKLQQLSSLRSLIAARDLWRVEGITKKIILQKSWAEILSELTSQKLIRMGFDQYLPKENSAGETDPSAYQIQPFLTALHTLQDIASIQGIIGGLMLCLSGRVKAPDQEMRSLAPYTPIAGNGIYFNPDVPFKLNDPEFNQNSYLLIVYVENRAVYVQKPEDPFNHILKYYGYVYGDRLNDVLHPILFRS